MRRYGWFLAFFALIAIPVLWSNRYVPGKEDLGPIWTESTRLKVFLEVPVFVCIAYAIWLLTPMGRRRVAVAGSGTSASHLATASQEVHDAVPS